jgi:two-component system phosphate regulon sensor histidine kinase PhoR
MQDITPLKELDRMKSDFVANVSHDLRTPLGAVQGYAEMLELAGPLTGDQGRFVQRILHQVETMTQLVESLLDLAKIEAGVEMEMAPCQLAAVIAESVDQMSGPASLKPMQLRVAVPDDLPLVWGNGRRLGQIVNNLLDNAIKYTPSGSEVALRAGVVGNEIRVDVADQGTGIAADDLPHLFEKFYRARRSGSGPRGTGLGLSIARSIIAAHGGRIWAESTEGQGATFSFALPVWKDRERAGHHPQPRDPSAESETKEDLPGRTT